MEDLVKDTRVGNPGGDGRPEVVVEVVGDVPSAADVGGEWISDHLFGFNVGAVLRDQNGIRPIDVTILTSQQRVYRQVVRKHLLDLLIRTGTYIRLLG